MQSWKKCSPLITGRRKDKFVLLSPKEQKFLEELMDAQRVIRKSTGDIIDGKFHIYEGPLMDEKKHPKIRKV